MSVKIYDKKELTKRFDISATTIYVGYASVGTTTNAAKWTIIKIALTAGSPTSALVSEHASAVWDNRTTETYK